MITEQDLQEAIAECEGQRNPTSNTCVKLAAFYAIRDRMYPSAETITDPVIHTEDRSYSMASGPAWDGKVEYSGETEFSRLISGMDLQDLIPVIDELMSTLQIVSPRIYAGVMRQISEL